MNRRITVLTIVSALAAVIVAYGAVTGYAAVRIPGLSRTSNAVVAQPAVLAAQASVTGTGLVAVDDSYTIADGQPLTVSAPGVLANDSAAVKSYLVTGASQGSVTLYTTGKFVWTPPLSGATGIVTFTYKAKDASGAFSSPAAVTITIGTPSSGGVAVVNTVGKDLYAASCSGCHGADGNQYPGITLGPTRLKNSELVAKLTAPNGSMNTYFIGAVSTTDIQAVADYVGTLGVVPSPTTTSTTTTSTTTTTTGASTSTSAAPATASNGATLYANSSCATCHGAGGFTPTIGNAAVVAKLTAPKGSMSGYVVGLSAADLQAIADFLVPPATGGGGAGTPATTPGTGTRTDTSTIDPTTGDGAYASYCLACHGADGTGTALGPDIVGESSSEIFKVVRNGDGTMPAFSSTMLSDATLADLADYMATFAPGTKSDHDDDGDDESSSKSDDEQSTKSDSNHDTSVATSDGATVYTSYCAACHGANGTGTDLGPDIVGESSSEIFKVVRNGDGTMPAFSFEMLSDNDLTALADYIASWGGSGDDDHKSSEDKGHDEDDD